MKKEVIAGLIVLTLLTIVYADNDVCNDDGICHQDEMNCEECAGAGFFQMYGKDTPDRTIDDPKNNMCKREEQCLWKAGASYEYDDQPERAMISGGIISNEPKCITSGQYILDYYCNNGQWTTRTAIVATALLELKTEISDTSNYRLFCGSHEDTINRMDVEIKNRLGIEYLQNCELGAGAQQLKPCVNNICVLETETPQGTKTAIGTSFNQPVKSDKGFLAALDLPTDACDNVGANNIELCSPEKTGTATVYLDNVFNTIYYITPKITNIPLIVGAISQKLTQKKDEFKTKTKTIFGTIEGQKYDVIRKMNHYNKIYLAKKANTEIFAMMENNVETPALDILAIQYLNITFTQNPCETYFKTRKTDPLLDCENQKSTNQQFIVARTTKRIIDNAGFTGIIGLWRQATAKLR